MKPILSMVGGKSSITFEVTPECVVVGAGHMKKGTPLEAVVGVVYDPYEAQLIRLVSEEIKAQGGSPKISMFEETVQVSFTLSPILPKCKAFLNASPFIKLVAGDLEALHVTSLASMFPNDPTFIVFKKCFERDKFISLLAMVKAELDDHGGYGEPFAVFPVKELGTRFESFL